MSQASVGSGSANDDNENHPLGTVHSKTLGAEPERRDPMGAVTPASTKLRFDPKDAALPGSGELPPGDPLRSVSPAGSPADPDDFPDGPSVAPSPWEKDARGKNKP
jgi:hypothetical protein